MYMWKTKFKELNFPPNIQINPWVSLENYPADDWENSLWKYKNNTCCVLEDKIHLFPVRSPVYKIHLVINQNHPLKNM